MPSLLEFLYYALAVWRLSYMLVEEDGPFEMFNGLRWLVGTRWIVPSSVVLQPVKTTWFDQHWFDKPHWLLAIVKTPYGILDCIYCCSAWVAGGFLILHHFLPLATDVASVWLALSAVAIFIKEKLVI